MPRKLLRIAIADDEVDIRDYLQKVLPRIGHQVVSASENGTDLIAACRTTAPDLIITDLKMPGGDGISALKEIWRDQPIPAIIISAFPQDIPDWLQGHPLLVATLVKPVKTTDLEPILDKLTST